MPRPSPPTVVLPQAQLVDGWPLNISHLPTRIASKLARAVLAAQGRQLVDFSMRRVRGADAVLHAARAAFLCGFAGTATAEAGRRFGIPVFGTMAHAAARAPELMHGMGLPTTAGACCAHGSPCR